MNNRHLRETEKQKEGRKLLSFSRKFWKRLSNSFDVSCPSRDSYKEGGEHFDQFLPLVLTQRSMRERILQTITYMSFLGRIFCFGRFPCSAKCFLFALGSSFPRGVVVKWLGRYASPTSPSLLENKENGNRRG